ncbi:MAG: carbohydrate porin [Pseudomonadota bacterium]|nr:carbohydrate porin [Pseudomonadota bacterium]
MRVVFVGAAVIAGPARADSAPDYSANLFGDLGGLRTAFAKVGGQLNLTETSEAFANPVGGLQRGADYDGLTTLTVQLDAKTAFGWEGGQFKVSALQLHGEDFSARRLGALQVVSGVSGDRATRLWELWWDQKFGDHFDVKFGQQSLDFEFANHPSAGYFVNSLFGSPVQFATDLPGGGPVFPLAALGVRARAASGPWTALAGVFSGTPAPLSNTDPQRANPYGVSFPVQGALAIAEAQFALGQGERELAGVYKLGGWYDSLGFADKRYNALGQRLASPAAVRAPLLHSGEFGLYAIGEQMVWRGAEKERTLSLFLRPVLAPQGDRNLVTFSLNGGLALRDPLPGRKDDAFTLGFGLVEIGAGAAGFSADVARYNPGVFTPKRDYEAVLEASYQYQATAWAQIQPSLQYVRNPGGGLVDPLQPDRKVGDALVAGLRVNLTF